MQQYSRCSFLYSALGTPGRSLACSLAPFSLPHLSLLPHPSERASGPRGDIGSLPPLSSLKIHKVLRHARSFARSLAPPLSSHLLLFHPSKRTDSPLARSLASPASRASELATWRSYCYSAHCPFSNSVRLRSMMCRTYDDSIKDLHKICQIPTKCQCK